MARIVSFLSYLFPNGKKETFNAIFYQNENFTNHKMSLRNISDFSFLVNKNYDRVGLWD